MNRPLTDRQIRALRTIAWMMEAHGGPKRPGALVTNSEVTRRDVNGLIRRGLAESAGRVVVVDGDGFTVEPEREREGFVLTAKGSAVLAKIDEVEA